MTERKNYKEILNKYDILQKEQIDVKSKLTAEKEKLQRYDFFIIIRIVYLLSYNEWSI